MNFWWIILAIGICLPQAPTNIWLNVGSHFQGTALSILAKSPTPLYKDANIEVHPFFETIHNYKKAPPSEIAKAVQNFYWKDGKNYVIYIVKVRGKKPRVLIKSDISAQWDVSHATSTEFRYFFFCKKRWSWTPERESFEDLNKALKN